MSNRISLYYAAVVIVLVSACTDFVLMPPHTAKEVTGCKAPPIMQNVVGTWRWGLRANPFNDSLPRNAPFTNATFDRMGVISFDRDGGLKDPDFIWGKTFSGDGNPVLYLTYKLDKTQDPYNPWAEYAPFKVILYGKDFEGRVRDKEIWSYSVIANECNYIHLFIRSGGMEIVLRR